VACGQCLIQWLTWLTSSKRRISVACNHAAIYQMQLNGWLAGASAAGWLSGAAPSAAASALQYSGNNQRYGFISGGSYGWRRDSPGGAAYGVRRLRQWRGNQCIV